MRCLRIQGKARQTECPNDLLIFNGQLKALLELSSFTYARQSQSRTVDSLYLYLFRDTECLRSILAMKELRVRSKP